MQKVQKKLIFSIVMMFIAYSGFAQSDSKRSNATFSNGDEAIRIISKTDKNIIKLTTKEDYNKYEILELSNHEVIHKTSNRSKLIETQTEGYSVVDRLENEEEELDDNDDSEGA